MNHKNTSNHEPIAIVGIGCRFPGAKGPREFWQLLADGVDAISEVPSSRFDIDALYDANGGAEGKISSRYGGFLSDVESFDASFFGISPREAAAMDPQQRILAEVAYEAMEDAGNPPDAKRMAEAGVFLGMMSDDYLRLMYRGSDLDLTIAAGGARGTASARISYAFGFQGPSMVVDADRASSLTAVHLACQSLRMRECTVALAGACNLILGPELSIACSRSGILSPDGRCKFCDARADGIGRSEGCGVLVLKRLQDALDDQDRVYAIVRGSAVSNNGSSSMEMMRPSALAQERLLRAAIRDAGVAAEDILYVEAHGTGTRVGDQVEIEAMGSVFGSGRSATRPCRIGSVKTNIGHAEAAGGIAGLIKVALSLHHGLIPKSLHFEQERPGLDLEERRLRVQTETTPWPSSDGKAALAGVSAFGLTGALAHAVLEAAPAEAEQPADRPESSFYLLPVSARSASSLDALIQSYRDWLDSGLSADLLPRICHSASVHRQHHAQRACFVASSLEQLREQLSAHLRGEGSYPGGQGCVSPAKKSKVAFIFPGQGAQRVGMGRELLVREPVFRAAVEMCDVAIRAEAGWSVLELLQNDALSPLLEEIDYLQPTLTTVMIALAALWRSWGIVPDAVLGSSMGEAAAAHVAGMLDLKDTMAVVCRRARLLKRLRGKGVIASVPVSFDQADAFLAPYRPLLSIAVVAGPENTVLSGDPAAMRALAEELESRGLPCRFVNSDVAGHSTQTEALLDELRAELVSLMPRRGSIPLASTVDDAYIEGPELNADYWARNLRQTVLQMNGIARLLHDGYTSFVEVSPHPVAWNPLWETIRHLGVDAAAVASLRHEDGEREALLKSVGALYVQGISPNWQALFGDSERKFLPLPTYRWEHKAWWFNQARSETPTREKIAIPVSSTAPEAGAGTRLLDELRGMPPAYQRKRLRQHLQSLIVRILRLPTHAEPDVYAPLRHMGLTSLMATEFSLELERTLKHPCPATLVFNYPTIEKLADHLLEQGVASLASTAETVGVDEGAADSGGPSMHSAAWIESAAESAVQTSQAGLAEPIAIIGVACRFPGGAITPDDYWQMLRGGVDAVTEVPSDRWNVAEYYDPDPDAPGKMYSRWGGFLESIDRFDAAYFGISPREATALDPQQRMLLEVTVEAMESAGLAPDPQRSSSGGVFVGIMNNNDFVSVKRTAADLSRLNAHDSTGQATSAAAGRLSYTLGFQGPSMAVDTACSSSLVAIHLACQSLRGGECRIAVAGGVNVIIAPETTVAFCKTRMLSPTGRCRTFDARADGYVRGEGCGMIVLKRLSDAVQDKDNILAIVRGSAVNQDGRSSSLTAPNGIAQQALVRRALKIAGVNPADVDYVEAHGTGTALGDPIELESLGAVLREGRDTRHPFLVGSVKTNIGHLESAAGVAGLIKVILALQNEEIPPHLHLEQVNPHVSLAACRASIPTRPTPWPRGGKKRVAGISSFGFVGTNAHVILEEAPGVVAARKASPPPVHRLLALSARSPEALNELLGRYSRLLSRRSIDMDDLCYTANTGRVHHEVRAAIAFSNAETLRSKLTEVAGRVASRHIGATGPAPKVAFLFTGQGSQYPFMGRKLFDVEPVFRSAFERCAEIMDPLLPTSLLSVIGDPNPEPLQQTLFAQPALFALEYALYELWRSWGVEPDMVMGHSLGEYTASVASQVLSLEQAARLVVTRGRLMHSTQTPGGSAVVFASEDSVRPYVEPHQAYVAVAAENAPERVLVAGELKHLQIVCDALMAKGIEVRAMAGMVAPHCPLMDPILDAFEAMAALATYSAPAVPMVSTCTGQLITSAEVKNPKHWRNLIRDKVRFREGMDVLYEAGCRIFVEIGPRQTLLRLGEMCLPFADITWLASLSKEKHDQEQILESLGHLYTRGVPVDWVQRHHPFAGNKVELPTTVFERRRFWPDVTRSINLPRIGSASQPAISEASVAQLIGNRVRSPLDAIQFEAQIDLTSLRMLDDHKILGSLLVPGAAHMVRVLGAIRHLTGQRRLELLDALFPEPLVLIDTEDVRTAQLVLTRRDNGYDFKIASIPASGNDTDAWRIHCTGHARVVMDKQDEVEANSGGFKFPSSRDEASMQSLAGEEFYALQGEQGYSLGPTFRWLSQVWLGDGHALGILGMPSEIANSRWQGLHPGLIDSCLQLACRVAIDARADKTEQVLVPAAISGLRFRGDREVALQGELHCRIDLQGSAGRDVSLQVEVFEPSGKVVLSIAELYLRPISGDALSGRVQPMFDKVFHHIVWSDSQLVNAPPGDPGRWLIFADEGGTADALAGLMRGRGGHAVSVFRAQALGINSNDSILKAESQAVFASRIARMQAECGSSWQGIVYLWGLDTMSNQGGGPFVEEHASSAAGLLHLMKAMIACPDCPPVWIATRGAQRTQRESKVLAMEQAMLWGAGRVLANEHPAFFGGLIDLDPHGIPEDAAAQILDELWATTADTQIAYRSGKRLAPQLKPLAKATPRSRFNAHPDATYLITGGFGALGRKVAEWLIASGARHLALLSRNKPCGETNGWMQRIGEQGVQIVAFQADVAVIAEVSDAFNLIDRTMPPMRGVIHAAGILEDSTVTNLSWQSFARVQAPKARGSWNLHVLTLERPLDFWIVFSSVTALLGNPGQTAYVAGNSYADALVHFRRMQGAPAMSVNWGPWNGDGMSAGMGEDLFRRWGLIPIDPSEGVEMLGQLIQINEAQAWAAPFDSTILKKRLGGAGHLGWLSGLVEDRHEDSAPQREEVKENPVARLRTLPDEARQAAIHDHVAELVRSVTGMDPSEPVRGDARFETLGVDSLLTLDLLNALSRFFSVHLPTTVLINYPTIESLVQHLSAEMVESQAQNGQRSLDNSALSATDTLQCTLTALHLP